jgi:hypothetical protein
VRIAGLRAANARHGLLLVLTATGERQIVVTLRFCSCEHMEFAERALEARRRRDQQVPATEGGE